MFVVCILLYDNCSCSELKTESFSNGVFHLVSHISQNEMVMLAGDMNGHVRSSNVGYDGGF